MTIYFQMLIFDRGTHSAAYICLSKQTNSVIKVENGNSSFIFFLSLQVFFSSMKLYPISLCAQPQKCFP